MGTVTSNFWFVSLIAISLAYSRSCESHRSSPKVFAGQNHGILSIFPWNNAQWAYFSFDIGFDGIGPQSLTYFMLLMMDQQYPQVEWDKRVEKLCLTQHFGMGDIIPTQVSFGGLSSSICSLAFAQKGQWQTLVKKSYEIVHPEMWKKYPLVHKHSWHSLENWKSPCYLDTPTSNHQLYLC